LPIRRLSWSEGVRRGFPELKTLSVELPVNRTACTDCGEYLPCIYVTAVMLTFWPPPDRSRVFACKLTMFVRLTLCPRLDSTCRSASCPFTHTRPPPRLWHYRSCSIPLRHLDDFLPSWRALIDYSAVRTKALSGSSAFPAKRYFVFKILSCRCRYVCYDRHVLHADSVCINEERYKSMHVSDGCTHVS